MCFGYCSSGHYYHYDIIIILCLAIITASHIPWVVAWARWLPRMLKLQDAGWGCARLFLVCAWFEWHDLNGNQEWLGSTTTNRHGVAAFDFTTVCSCGQFVVGPTRARGGTLDLMTDVPDLLQVSVIAPIGNSLLSVGSHFDGSGCSKLVYS